MVDETKSYISMCFHACFRLYRLSKGVKESLQGLSSPQGLKLGEKTCVKTWCDKIDMVEKTFQSR